MGLDIFGKKKNSSLKPHNAKKELNIPPPPPPPGKVSTDNLPSFEVPKEDKIAPPIFNKEDKRMPKPESGFNSADLDKVKQELPDLNSFGQERSVNKSNRKWEELQKKPKHKKPVKVKLPHHKKEISEVKKSLKRSQIGDGKPFYVNMDYYKQIQEDINVMNRRLTELDSTMHKIETNREKQNSEFRNWRNIFENMRKKLLFMDEILFER
ncbi:MAG: hypothetical protein MAG795_00363 [Candidatus Woesearchaeota archaeon]|nr:hypothetical protein [Candidatus Woesearchaeota archaeon]